MSKKCIIVIKRSEVHGWSRWFELCTHLVPNFDKSRIDGPCGFALCNVFCP
ncbi:hypothetical protein Hanom_Chr12g01177981 [Helianthus anomalus]